MAVAAKTKLFVTDAQVRFVKKLVNDRVVTMLDEDPNAVLTAVLEDSGAVDRREVSKLIDAMLALPKRSKPAVQVADLGYYLVDGNHLYVVSESQDGKRRYAKRLEFSEFGRATWVYARGAVQALAEQNIPKLTVEEAAVLGRRHGVCVLCGRTLTDPASVEAGIGPICAGRL